MIARFLRALWPTLEAPARRRIVVGAMVATVVAVLDAVGITLVLPLARLMTTLDADTLPPELEGIGDVVGTDDPGRLAALLAAAIVTCFIAKGLLALAMLRSTLTSSLQAEATMAGRLLRGYLSAPLEFHLHRNSADLQRTIHDATRRVYQEALVTAVPALGDQLILVVVSLVLLIVAPVEALVGAGFMVGLISLYRRLTARRAAASSDALIEQGKRSLQYVQQALSSVREVQLSGHADQFAEDLLEVRQEAAVRLRVITLTEMLPRYYLELGIVIGAGLVGAVAFARHPSTEAVALLALFLAAALRLLPSLNRTLVAEAKARAAMPNLARITDDLAELDAHRAHLERTDIDPLASDEPFDSLALVALEVRFRDAAEPVLRGVDLRIERGERVVLVGRSGSGKTTALNAMLGFLEPASGAVSVNGAPLASRRRSWQRRVAYVPQDVTLLDAPITANVALGRRPSDVDRDAVLRALHLVQLDEVIAELPGGIDGGVGEGGARMSGGQRQRLGLARALYETPEVLVLDEATSALDARTEADILDILDDLGPTTTVVAVAHREQAIRRFDRVVLFDAGRIVADGTVDEVLAAEPAIARLVLSVADDAEPPGPTPV